MSAPAVVGYCNNPLRGMRSADMRPATVGVPIGSLAPFGQSPTICRLNGEWLLRESWNRPVLAGDVIEWYELPQEREELKFILQAAITVVASYIGGPVGFAFAIAGTLALNHLLPIKPPVVNEPAAPSPTYATGVSGNQMRLYQPVPKIAGRHLIYPSYACQAYTEFEEDGSQTFYALYVVGHGNHELERELIEDTDLAHFVDVTTHAYLAPGEMPTVVIPNVVSSPEVAGAAHELLTGEYVGGFAACGPRALATHIGIDIIAPKGLGLSDSGGSIGEAELRWDVEFRRLNEFGSATSGWSVLASETRTASSNEPQRYSAKYELPEPMRVEIRLVRRDVRNPSLYALHDAVWAGLRAYLDGDVLLNPNVAHYELVMRASKQLSNVSQQRVALIVTGMCRTWHPDTGWGDEVATRNPAWWLADLWSNPVWGEGLSDDRIDLQSIYELAQIWEQRQDRFDFVFDSTMNAWEAATLIARAGRARPFRRGPMRTVARDQWDPAPVTAFTSRNTVPGSMRIKEMLPTRDTPDGVIVEYFDNRQWDWLPIECPAPGITAMARPVRMRLAGVTGRTHAEREGLYEAAQAYYRTQFALCVTEMQGVLPSYLSTVRWQGDIAGYGQTGDVQFWDADNLVMALSEPPAWTGEALYLQLVRDDGSLTTPVIVTPGAGQYDVVLPAEPDFELVLDDGTRERPKYLLGKAVGGSELVKVGGITDGGRSEDGAQLYRIGGLVDDERAHTADEHLLPSPDEIQDPIDTSPGDDGGGTAPVVNMTDHLIASSGSGVSFMVGFIFNGTIGQMSANYNGHTIVLLAPQQWLYVSPVESSVTALFEVRFTLLSGSLSLGADLLDDWLPASVDYDLQVYNDGLAGMTAEIQVQVRNASNLIVQDTCVITLVAGIDVGG